MNGITGAEERIGGGVNWRNKGCAYIMLFKSYEKILVLMIGIGLKTVASAQNVESGQKSLFH